MSAPRPLARHLESPTDEARVSRMWRAIERARRRPEPRRWRWVALPAALAAVALVGFLAWPRPIPAPPPVTERAPTWSVPDRFEAAAPRRFALPDGSAITLAAGARLTTIESGDARFVTLLERGAATFEVRPGGPRRWVVEGGLVTVEVVGTVFEVIRREHEVEVRVARGIVLVRGERVPDRVARLRAGESIVVTDRPAPAEPPAAMPAPAEPAPPAPVAARVRPAGAPAEDLGALVAAASAAQRDGDLDRAASLLHRAMAHDDPRAALAAYTLGRLEMDELRRPARARAAFRRALALGLPERLAQQAEARLHQLR